MRLCVYSPGLLASQLTALQDPSGEFGVPTLAADALAGQLAHGAAVWLQAFLPGVA